MRGIEQVKRIFRMNEERKIEIEEVDAVDTAAARPRRPTEVRAQARLSRRLPRRREAGRAEPAAPGGELQEAVVEALKSIYDPEIPVDIYELGLIYDVDDQRGRRRGRHHDADHAALPGRRIDAAARSSCACCRCPGIRDAEVKLVWDPPWDPSKMSDEARLELGML